MKICTKCEKSKPTTEFYKNASKSDGLQSHCKVCFSTDRIARYAANPDRARASSTKWQASNPERVKENGAKWRDANREKIRHLSARWYAENHDAYRMYNINRRARKRANGGTLSKGLADRLFKLQRGKCACGCGQPLGTDYHLDHIMPLALGGPNTDDNIQLLRATCNLQKKAKHPVDFMQSRGFLL